METAGSNTDRLTWSWTTGSGTERGSCGCCGGGAGAGAALRGGSVTVRDRSGAVVGGAVTTVDTRIDVGVWVVIDVGVWVWMVGVWEVGVVAEGRRDVAAVVVVVGGVTVLLRETSTPALRFTSETQIWRQVSSWRSFPRKIKNIKKILKKHFYLNEEG